MSLEQENPYHSAMEAALASLMPVDVQLNRDRLLYLTGMQAANSGQRRMRQMWLAGAIVSVLVSVGLAGVFITRGRPDVPEQVANVAPETTKNESEPIQSIGAFDPIWDVDHWDVERLLKAGITVEPWKHDLQGEDPPFEWVRISFDCSQIAANQDVLMTASFMPSPLDTGIACRDVRSPKHKDSVSILCAVRDQYLAGSDVTIFIWKPRADGGSEASGYRMSMKRIIQLARLKAAPELD